MIELIFENKLDKANDSKPNQWYVLHTITRRRKIQIDADGYIG